MGRYAMLKKEFKFLAKVYGFKICMKQKSGSYYFIEWTNPNKNIMVLYDEQDEVPLTIRIYDADSLGFDAAEYKNEFTQTGKPRENIRSAAEWLRSAIEDNDLLGFDAAEYKKELEQTPKPRENIRSAVEWLRKAVKEKIIMLLRLN